MNKIICDTCSRTIVITVDIVEKWILDFPFLSVELLNKSMNKMSKLEKQMIKQKILRELMKHE